jgi:ABC-type transport system involved in multi-copper enzyme maturation permease subunit
METELTTKTSIRKRSPEKALLWKAWLESRARFFAALVLLIGTVTYAVLISNSWLARYNLRHPGEPLLYSAFIWSGLFNWLLQGSWILAAFVLGLGGLRREGATGAALFTLGLPIGRSRLMTIRATLLAAECAALALLPSLLIPILSRIVGQSYPTSQALEFGVLMGCAGLVFPCFGLLLSTLFEGEFTAPVLGICIVATVFFGSKQPSLHRWSIFDVMNGASFIDPSTQLLVNSAPWLGLGICLLAAFMMLYAATSLLKSHDF